MKPFRQLIPQTSSEVVMQIQAVLTIDAFETDHKRREQIDTRIGILSKYLPIYNQHMNAEFYFIKCTDGTWTLTCN